MSREEALAIIKSREAEMKRLALYEAQLYFQSPSPLPQELYDKALAAGNQYGEFNLHQDWYRHLISELQDSVVYRGFMQVQYEVRTNTSLWLPKQQRNGNSESSSGITTGP